MDVSQDQYEEAIYGYGNLQYAFIDPETENAIGGPLAYDWSEVPMWPAEAGSYTLTAKPINLPVWFPVEIPSIDIPLHIVEKSRPWLNVVFADPSFGMLALQFAPNALDEETQLTLFYSTDKGETWKNVSEDFPDATVRADFIDIIGLLPNTNYWFYAETTDGDVTNSSNIIYHPNFTNDTDVDFSFGGGDRDEDDFGDQGEEPPAEEIIPPANKEPSDNTDKIPLPETNNTTDKNSDTPASNKEPSDNTDKKTSSKTNNTTSKTNNTPTNSPSKSAGTTSKDTTDTTAATTEQQNKSNSSEIKENDANSTLQTENFTEPTTAETTAQPQKDGASMSLINIVLILLGIAVAGGIAGILFLRRKGGHR